MVARRGSLKFLPARVLAMGMLGLLAACSSVPDAVNPVSWYRDLSGASKNDTLDKDQPNQANLDAGGKHPYPNLADVPNAPGTAASAIDRDALQKSLIADRRNANYTDEQLRAGTRAQGLVPSPPPAPASARPPASSTAAATTAADAAPPQESSLVSPTIPNVPTGETPAAPPPPPKIPPPTAHANAAPAAASPPGARRAVPGSSDPVATIVFANGSASLSDSVRNQLSEIAAMQHDRGGTIRVIGHAESLSGASVAQQQLAQFDLALTRARAVAQLLSADGVPAQSIAVEAAPGRAEDADASHAEIYLEH